MWIEEPFLWPHPWFLDGVILGIMGIQLPVMRQISQALRTGEAGPLMDLKTAEEPEFPQKLEGMKVDGSVYSDGTIVGELTLSRRRPPELGMEEVLL